MKMSRAVWVLALALPALACAESDEGAAPEWVLSRSPAFVNRVIPGERPLALVTSGDQEGERVELTAVISLDGGTVALRPASIGAGEVSEVWVDLPSTDTETPFTVTVTGTRGTTEHTVIIDATAIPGADDLAPMADQIIGVFLDELGGTVEGLPPEVAGLARGTPVAGLLVVSHYAWFTDEYEVGLSWHIMIAPDDWAEIYLRPRDQLQPTRAFRLDSWSTALDGGEYAITEVDPPVEVMR
ncbi:MAG: hypothetical protein Q7V88_00325 [Actinomycetota bacterium]|nr:hypothetical protein [Actinomycetota bacterium]